MKKWLHEKKERILNDTFDAAFEGDSLCQFVKNYFVFCLVCDSRESILQIIKNNFILFSFSDCPLTDHYFSK